MAGVITGAVACTVVGLMATGASWGTGMTHDSVLSAAATTLGSILGNWTYDRAKDWVHTVRERPGLATEENHVITRALRGLQIECIAEIAAEWRKSTAGDRKPAHQAEIRAFDEWLTDYLKHAKERAKTLLVQELPNLDEADRLSLGEMEAHWPGQALQAGLASRHGDPQALGGWSRGATLLILAELRQDYGDALPTSFIAHMVGPAPHASRWFDRFTRRAAAKLSKDQEFRNRWQTEQQAVILLLGQRTNEGVGALVAAIPVLTKALTDLGTRLDAVAGDVQAIGAVVGQINAALQDVRSWLSFEDRSCEGLLRFASWNPAIPFVGREQEMVALQSFLDAGDEPFVWWIVTGPGGAGKTRLARELCLSAHAQGWRAGFLEDQPPELWQPAGKLLIIADYAGAKMDEVRSLALRLRRLCAGKPVRLRLLLIERVADKVFWDRFFGTGDSDEGALKRTRHSEHAVEVPDLGEDALWALLRPRPWMERPTPLTLDRATFFERLTKVDAQKRALVAMILAEAEEAGMAGTLEALLRRLIDKTRTRYALPETPADAPLLISAATMAGCLEGELLTAVEQAIGRQLKLRDLELCAHAMGGSSAPEAGKPPARRLAGAQPDLIGEFFVLETLRPEPLDPSDYPWLAREVWRHAPQAMAAFCLRAVQNFAAHPAIALLMDPPEDNEKSIGWFSDFAWATSALPSPRLPWPLRERCVDVMQHAVGRYLQNDNLREAFCAIFANTLIDAQEEGDTPRRDALLRHVRNLAVTRPKDAAVQEALAIGLAITLYYARAEGNIPRHDALLDDLRALARGWPRKVIREELAKGLLNALLDAKLKRNLPRRDALLDELRVLCNTGFHRDVLEPLPNALLHTLIHAKEEGDLTRRDALLEELRMLTVDSFGHATLHEMLGRADRFALMHAKEERHLALREELLDDLRALVKYMPDSAVLRNEMATSIKISAIWCAELGDTAGRSRYRAEFETLVAAWPGDEALQVLADALRRELDGA